MRVLGGGRQNSYLGGPERERDVAGEESWAGSLNQWAGGRSFTCPGPARTVINHWESERERETEKILNQIVAHFLPGHYTTLCIENILYF